MEKGRKRPVYTKILETINTHQMASAGEHILAAVSGGADSVCLLCVLNSLKETLGIRLEAIHVHHGLRGAEADRDAGFVKDLCQQLNIPLRIVKRDVAGYAAREGVSLEEAGRILRYEAFYETARERGCEKIAVAHHLDDQAETILHHMVRGSGLRGLGGIRPVRDQIIRPLLYVSRDEILSWLDQEGLSFCQDSTNGKNHYTRNRLRNQILPLLKQEINPSAAENIARVGRLSSAADEYLTVQAEKLFAAYGVERDSQTGIPISVLKSQESIIQTYLLLHMIKKAAARSRDITFVHVEQVQKLAEKTVGKQVSLPYDLTAKTDYTHLWISRGKCGQSGEKEAKSLPILEYQQFPYEKHMKIPENQYTKWFDYDKIKGTLSFRFRETGDYFLLPSGGRKSVKSYMIDRKIPADLRGRIPLLAEGSQVLWLVGYRISEFYKVTEDTKQILQVQMNGGEEHG